MIAGLVSKGNRPERICNKQANRKACKAAGRVWSELYLQQEGAFGQFRIIIIAVKPADITTVLEENRLWMKASFISVAAGVTTQSRGLYRQEAGGGPVCPTPVAVENRQRQ